MKFRVEFLLPILLLNAVLLHSAPAGAQEKPDLAVAPTLSHWYRPGCQTPITVTVKTHDAPFAGTLHIITDTTELRLQVDLPVACTRLIHVIVAPAADPAVRVRLFNSDFATAEASVTLKKLAPTARLALLLGRSQQRFNALMGALPAEPVLDRITIEALPQDYRGYEAADLLIVSDFSVEPSKQQRQALTRWLYGGGRMLFIMPANGFGLVNDFWQRFLPSPLLDANFKIRSFSADSQPGGIRIFSDPSHAGLTGFYTGAGRVLLASYGQTADTATEEARSRLARAIVRLLELDEPPAATSLFEPEAYELFESRGWPASVRRTLWIAAAGYLMAMIVIVKVLSREKPAVFGAATAGFSAVCALVIYGAVLPSSTTILQTVTSVRTTPGSASARLLQYRRYSSASNAPITVVSNQPLEPVFYSNRMLKNGPVPMVESADGWRCTVMPGSGKPSIFQHRAIVPFGGSLSVSSTATGFAIYNSLTEATGGRPVTLQDVILTNGTSAMYIKELPHRKNITLPFDADSIVNLTRLVWDTFGNHPQQHKILKKWLSEHPPAGKFYLLGWSGPGLFPPPRQNLLHYAPQPVFWEIELERQISH